MKIITLFIIILLPVSTSLAYDIEVGRQCGTGGVLMSSPTASDYLNCPTGILSKRKIIFESGYQRKYELSDLDQVFAAAGYRLDGLSVSLGFSQFGRNNYYVEQQFKSTLSYGYGMYVASVLLSSRLIEIKANSGNIKLSAVSLGLAGGVNYDNYHIGVVLDNINAPTLYDGDEKQNITYNIYGEIEGSDRFSITARLTLEQYEKPTMSIGQYIILSGRNAVFWGMSNNPLTYGGGVEVHHSFFGLIYAVSYHPVLGFTHNVSLNFEKGL
jgi:hypothetical protein